MTFAFFLESVGGGEWLLLLAVILVVVGPKNLPSAARKIGQIMSQLRRAADEFKRQLMTMDEEVHRAVDEVKQDYMNVGQEVQDTVEEDGTTSGASDGQSASGDENASYDAPPPSDDVDRAMWESYGRDYDPNGDYGYADYDTSSDDASADGASSAGEPQSETASAEQTAVSSDDDPSKNPSASASGVAS